MELIIVVVVIGILAALILPVLSKARDQGKRAVCVNNLKQVTAAWHLYSDEHEDRTAPNIQWAVWHLAPSNWVWGVMGYENVQEAPPVYTHAGSADKVLMLAPPKSVMRPYVQSAEVMRCPADRSYIELNGVRVDRARSYSMNYLIGGWRLGGSVPGSRTRASIRRRAFLLVEEHEDTLTDGQFLFGPSTEVAPTMGWNSLPTDRHRGAGTVSFTDGSVEVKRWEDPRTKLKVLRKWQTGPSAPDSVDVQWFAKQNVW